MSIIACHNCNRRGINFDKCLVQVIKFDNEVSKKSQGNLINIQSVQITILWPLPKRVGLYTHTAQALITRQVSVAIPNGNVSIV